MEQLNALLNRFIVIAERGQELLKKVYQQPVEAYPAISARRRLL